jgi:hypothetical protein
MNSLEKIVQQNREAAKIIPGFKGIGVQSQEGADAATVDPVEREGTTQYVNPRTGARVNVQE